MLLTIVGKRGKGKTTLAKNLLIQSEADQIFVFDYLGEYLALSSERIRVYRENLAEFCEYIWNNSGGNIRSLAVFDEVDLYGKNNEYISFLYRFGRHKKIEIIAVARRFYDLPVIIRALTDKFYLFQITEERDISYLKRLVSDDFVRKLISLENFQYINIEL